MKKNKIEYIVLEELNTGNKELNNNDIVNIFNSKLFELIIKFEKDII